MTVISNPLLLKKKAAAGGGSGFQIEKSLRFNAGDDPVLSRKHSVNGNRRTYTISFWLKRAGKHSNGNYFLGQYGDGAGVELQAYFDDSTDQITWYYDPSNYVKTNARFRDHSAWMHIVFAVDTTSPRSGDRIKVYINGESQTFATYNAPTQYADTDWNCTAGEARIGASRSGTSRHNYIADFYSIDGLQLPPSAFGEQDSNTGVWNPKAFAIPQINDGTTWSTPSYWSGTEKSDAPYDYAFDGNLGSSVSGTSATIAKIDNSSTTGWVNYNFTPPNPIKFVDKVEVCGGISSVRYSINNEPYFNGANTGDWQTIASGGGTINTINIEADNHYPEFRGFRVDGVVLLDGVTDKTYDEIVTAGGGGRTWSADLTTNDTMSNAANAFDGDTSTRAQTANNGANKTLTWAPSPPVRFTSKLEVYCDQGDNTPKAEWNGNSVSPGGGSWVTVYTGSGEISTSKPLVIDTKSAGQFATLKGVRLDDTVITNGTAFSGADFAKNSFHLKFNDTSLNRYLGKDTFNGKIADATGGLPILKTSDDYGDVKGSGYRADSNKSNLVLAVTGEGSIADVSHVSDLRNSGSAKSLSAQGDTAISTDDSRFYGSSIKFDGTGDYLTLSDSTDFEFGTGNYTIECWIKHTSISAQQTYVSDTGGNSAGVYFYKDTNHKLGLYYGAQIITGSTALAANHWYHIAVVRNSGTSKLYLNGVEDGSASDTNNLTVGNLAFGAHPDGSGNLFSGYMQELRVYKGTAKYTANFKPPTRNDFQTVTNLANTDGVVTVANADAKTKPIYVTSGDQGGTKGSGYNTDAYKSLLVFAVPGDTIADVSHVSDLRNSGSAVSITNRNSVDLLTTQSRFYGTSMWFDGNTSSNDSTGDAIHIDTSNVTIGTGEFTVEFWARPDSLFDNFVMFDCRHGTNNWPTNDDGFTIQSNAAGRIWSDGMTGGGASGLFATADGVFKAGEWQHLAATRDSSNTMRFFVNGKVVSSATSQTWDFDQTRMCWGNSASFGEGYKGFIQDIRVYKGSGACKYTSNFEVPNLGDAPGLDCLNDSPTNYGTDTGAGGEVRGTFCTWNPLNSNATLTQGNLRSTVSGKSSYGTFLLPNSGKWFWEIEANSASYIGVDNRICGGVDYFHYNPNGQHQSYVGGSHTTTNYGASFTTGDFIGVALNMDDGQITFYKNNATQGAVNLSAVGLTGKDIVPLVYSDNAAEITANFGQRTFKYAAAPAGYKCLCSTNLSDTFEGEAAGTVNNPSKFFDILQYTGDGETTQDIKGISFQPDLVWQKIKNQAGDHALTDAARGTSAGYLQTEDTNVETGNDNDGASAFLADGFTAKGGFNNNANKWVTWLWDAGTTAATASTEGSVTPSAQWVNNTAGFSITKWTVPSSGTYTVGHGLSVKPGLIICKNTELTSNWDVYHHEIGASYRFKLNTKDFRDAQSGAWNNTEPDADKFTTNVSWQGAADVMVAYAWTEIAGYSKFGKFVGKGAANFVYTGFRPRWIMIKRSLANSSGDSSTDFSGWGIVDTERKTYNGLTGKALWANHNTGEGKRGDSSTTTNLDDMEYDIVSNGFYLDDVGSENNSNTSDYIYAAFAEHPQKIARAR